MLAKWILYWFITLLTEIWLCLWPFRFKFIFDLFSRQAQVVSALTKLGEKSKFSKLSKTKTSASRFRTFLTLTICFPWKPSASTSRSITFDFFSLKHFPNYVQTTVKIFFFAIFLEIEIFQMLMNIEWVRIQINRVS